jgi:hypothetical protein
MKNVLAGRNERSLYKLVVDGETDEVVGIHMIGPDAPEILQAAAIAVKAKLKKSRLRRGGRAAPDHGRRTGADALSPPGGFLARRDHHRRGPQRPDLRLLSGQEGPEGRVLEAAGRSAAPRSPTSSCPASATRPPPTRSACCSPRSSATWSSSGTG